MMNAPVRSRGLRAMAAAALAPALLSTACFEIKQPVAERIDLAFLREREVSLKVTVKISNPRKGFDGSEQARERIRETQKSLMEKLDPWSPRFERVDWAREQYAWTKEEGELVLVTHGGTLADPTDLSRFFSDTRVDVRYRAADGEGEISVYTRGPSGGTAEQRKALEGFLPGWVSAVTRGIAATSELYEYLADHPDRAEPCVGGFYKDFLDPARAEALEPPTEDEEALLDEVGDALGEMVDALQIPDGAAYSPDEISRLVYDSFPAPLTVEVPGEIVELEGFERAGDRRFLYRGTSLLEALRGLEGRWCAPDLLLPVLPYLIEEKGKESFFDLDAFLALERRSTTRPSEQEVKAAVEQALVPRAVYRAVWRSPGGESVEAPKTQ